MNTQHLIALSCLIAMLGACSWGGRASVMDAAELFEEHREEYSAVAEAALAAPRLEGASRITNYKRGNLIFAGISDLPRFRRAALWPARSDGNSVRIYIFIYGFSVSGREVGLAYYADGTGPDFPPESSIRVFDDCAVVDLPENWVAHAYCNLGDGWYAFRHSF